MRALTLSDPARVASTAASTLTPQLVGTFAQGAESQGVVTPSMTAVTGVATYVAFCTFGHAIAQTPQTASMTGMGLTWTPVIDSFYDQAGSNRGRAMVFTAQGTATTGALTFSWSTINAALSLVLVAIPGRCTYVTNGGVGYSSSPGVAAAGSTPEVGSIMFLAVSDYSLSGDVGLDSDVTLVGKSGYSSVVKYQQTVAWRPSVASEPIISTTVPTPGEGWAQWLVEFLPYSATVLNYSGGSQDYVVGAGVTSITATIDGAQGGSNVGPATGGLGGRLVAAITTTPTETLKVYVGQQASTTTGGFNGGGTSGGSGSSQGRGGGGATDIRRGGTALGNRIAVAGGGGGAGSSGGASVAGGAGNGNGSGSDGTDGTSDAGSRGRGATTSAGGTGGTGDNTWGGGNGVTGASGVGGDSSIYHAGGGGSGIYGGGGGGGCSPMGGGGGGGSGGSLDGTVTVTSSASGYRSGNGRVIIRAN